MCNNEIKVNLEWIKQDYKEKKLQAEGTPKAWLFTTCSIAPFICARSVSPIFCLFDSQIKNPPSLTLENYLKWMLANKWKRQDCCYCCSKSHKAMLLWQVSQLKFTTKPLPMCCQYMLNRNSGQWLTETWIRVQE